MYQHRRGHSTINSYVQLRITIIMGRRNIEQFRIIFSYRPVVSSTSLLLFLSPSHHPSVGISRVQLFSFVLASPVLTVRDSHPSSITTTAWEEKDDGGEKRCTV